MVRLLEPGLVSPRPNPYDIFSGSFHAAQTFAGAA